MRNETGPKDSVRIYILEKYSSYKNEETSESETSEPEGSEKSNWSERLVRYSSNDHEKTSKNS